MGSKLASATIALMVLATAVVYSRLSSYQREHLLEAKQTAALAVTRLFAASCAAPIVFGDNTALKDALHQTIFRTPPSGAPTPPGAPTSVWRRSRMAATFEWA